MGEFIFDGNRWSLNLPYEVDYNNVEYMRFDLNKMQKLDGEGRLNYYVLIDDDTGLWLTSNESHHEYIKFDICTGELFGKFVFHEQTPFAIDFIEVLVDGRKQPPRNRWSSNHIMGITSINNFGIREVTELQNKYFITMTWRRIGQEGIFWYDGGGPYELYQVNPRHSRGYYIPSKSKTLEITYRIILPYPSLTIENLFDKNYKDKKYSNVNKISINLEDFFNSDSFRSP